MLGVADRVVDAEARAIVEKTRFARNDNRSLLGSVNDVGFHATVLLEDEHRIGLATLQRVQSTVPRGSRLRAH